VRPANYLVLPWILPFCFAVGAVISGRRLPMTHPDTCSPSSSTSPCRVRRPSASRLTLGASRRSFYFGTALLGMVSGLV
jgi:hypothetical protein